MDPNSGRIIEVKDAQEAKALGLIPIPDEQLAEVQAMDVETRKAWADKQRIANLYPDKGSRRARRRNAVLRRQASKRGGA